MPLAKLQSPAKCDYSSYEKPSIQTSKENVADSNEVKAMLHWILQPNQRTEQYLVM